MTVQSWAIRGHNINFYLWNIVPFLNERLTKFVRTTPQSSVQTIPDMLDGVEINVICPKENFDSSEKNNGIPCPIKTI